MHHSKSQELLLVKKIFYRLSLCKKSCFMMLGVHINLKKVLLECLNKRESYITFFSTHDQKIHTRKDEVLYLFIVSMVNEQSVVKYSTKKDIEEYAKNVIMMCFSMFCLSSRNSSLLFNVIYICRCVYIYK